MQIFQEESIFKNFMKNIDQYYHLYDQGLKKAANHLMNQMINDFKAGSSVDEQAELLYRLCHDICDTDKLSKLKRRGNARLPYPLDKLLWEYLKEESQQEKMPQLRWTYELYRYNPFDKQFNPYLLLETAFSHKKCDQKTVYLYFDSLLSHLAWGAHHFPEGCIISKETYRQTTKECYHVIKYNNICDKQTKTLFYYEALYDCYYEFEDSHGTENFYELCAAKGIQI